MNQGSLDRPKLLVILSSHNRPHYIRETIESILSQTYTDYYCIIFDNSTDDSIYEIFKSYNSYRLSYFRSAYGVSSVDHGRIIQKRMDSLDFEFYTCVHDDDVLDVRHFEYAIPYFDNDAVKIVAPRAISFNDSGRIIDDFDRRKIFMKGVLGVIRHCHINPFATPSSFYRKGVLNCYFEFGESLLGMADYASNIYNVFTYGVLRTSESTYWHRSHGGSDLLSISDRNRRHRLARVLAINKLSLSYWLKISLRAYFFFRDSNDFLLYRIRLFLNSGSFKKPSKN